MRGSARFDEPFGELHVLGLGVGSPSVVVDEDHGRRGIRTAVEDFARVYEAAGQTPHGDRDLRMISLRREKYARKTSLVKLKRRG